MTIKKPLASIPRSTLVFECSLDGGAIDTNDVTKVTVTTSNVAYENTDSDYQKQRAVANGTSSKISTTANYALAADSNFTISMVFNSSVNQGTTSYIIGNFTNTAGISSLELIKDFDGTGVNNGWITLVRRNGGSSYQSLKFQYVSGKSHHIFITNDSSRNISIWRDNELVASGTNPNGGTSTGGLYLMYANNNSNYVNGRLQSFRLYNSVLDEEDRRALFLASRRKLGLAGDSDVMGKMAAVFETDGGDVLYDVQNGTVATRTAGSATTDDFGITKALTNPNYSWPSVTYNAAYSWENSGSGWNLAKNPSGVSATGINRTTTFRQLFLSSSALSADEETQLARLCAIGYPSLFRKSLPSNLGIKFHFDGRFAGTTAWDQSGNGNGTLDSPLSYTNKKFQSYFSAVSATDKITFPNVTGARFVSAWIYPTANNKVIATVSSGKTVSINSSNVLTSASLTNPVYYVNGKVGTALALNKWQHVLVSFDAENTSSGSFGSDSFTGDMADCIVGTELPSRVDAQRLFHSTYIH